MSMGDAIDLTVLVDYEDYMQKLTELGMNWVIIAYVAMVGARLACTEARGMGDDLSLKNPLHGLLFWFLVKDFLCYSVVTYHISIPGLQVDDGDAESEKLSSHATVVALAEKKIAALTLVCEQQSIRVPDFSPHFFKTITPGQLAAESAGLGHELQGEDGPSDTEGGSDNEDDDEEDARKRQRIDKNAQLRAR